MQMNGGESGHYDIEIGKSRKSHVALNKIQNYMVVTSCNFAHYFRLVISGHHKMKSNFGWRTEALLTRCYMNPMHVIFCLLTDLILL